MNDSRFRSSAPFRPLGKFQGPTRNAPSTGAKPTGAAGASGTPQVGHSSFGRPAMDQQQRPPPNTYVCYRCGKKGEHWIQFCPTNNDKSFEPIGIKKTTGIPRSFLKTVESDTLQSKKGVMVTQDGNLVVATTNEYERSTVVVSITIEENDLLEGKNLIVIHGPFFFLSPSLSSLSVSRSFLK